MNHLLFKKVVTLQDQVVSLLNQQTEVKPVKILKENIGIEMKN